MRVKFGKFSIFKTDILASYQIFGGLFGLGLFIYLLTISLLREITPSFLMIAIYLFGIGLFCYSIFCGILIFKNLRSGLKHS